MAYREMSNTEARRQANKMKRVCVFCGKRIKKSPKYKDYNGNYICEECYDDQYGYNYN